MGLIFTLLLVAFGLAFLLIKILKPLAIWLTLVDHPGGRKQHAGKIPLVGGIAIYLSVLISSLWFNQTFSESLVYLSVAAVLVVVGVIDDRFDLNAILRLGIQLAVSSFFVLALDIRILSLGNLLGTGEIEIGVFAIPVSILALVASINAFNMLDGIDGLVGMVALATFLALGILFLQNGNTGLAVLSLSFVGALGAFLIFNVLGKPGSRHLRKIFMGDAGSMFVGLIAGVLVIKGSQGQTAVFSPITALWLILLPLLDMFSIMINRVARSRSPFHADRTHLHHILMRSGIGRLAVLNVMLELHVIFIGVGIVFFQVSRSQASPSDFPAFLALLLAALLCQVWSSNCSRFIRWNKRRHKHRYYLPAPNAGVKSSIDIKDQASIKKTSQHSI